MSLASIKEDTEAYIKNNWTETPIFYYPENISGNNAILLKFAQVDRELYSSGCGNGRKLDTTMMSIFFYAPNTLKGLKDIDAMNTLLECYEFDNTIYELGVPDGNGPLDLTNGIVEMKINYISKTYN